MSITIQNLNKHFGAFHALKNINLNVPTGKLVSLLGPSGCGKTTLLRIIAGLENADGGNILFDGQDVTAKHVRERKVGFVFQHYALFRHMNVFDNVAFGLTVLPKSERPSKEQIRAKVEEEMKGSTAVRPGLVSKIERVEAIENLDEIILASDGIMVARGDLAVEVGHAAVPALQKRMIRRARELRRFSITATQMMESMITNPVPTRAEVSDVANAVLDGTDAVMCSAETAVGAYPFETVSQMAIICAAAEKEQDSLNGVAEQVDYPEAVSTNLAIAGGAVSVARAVHAKAIVALTESGSTAFEVSRHNITLPIFALTPSISAQRRMAMYRGVRPLILATSTDHDTALNEVEAMLVEHKILSSGDQYIITSGSQMRESGSTNTLEVLRVK